MRDAIDAGNIRASASSQEEAAQLHEDFTELILRVNMDLATQRFNPGNPISVESAIAQVERSIDYHLQAFAHKEGLQSLSAEIKARFRQGIEAQATDVA